MTDPNPFALIAACRRVHAAVDDVDAAIAAGLKLNRNDLRCLNALEAGPLSAGQIRRRTGLTSGAVTSLLDRLEQTGFVVRERGDRDRRVVTVRIADGAFSRLAILYKSVAATMMAAFEDMPSDERDAAIAALDRFADAYAAAGDALPWDDLPDQS